MKLIDLHANKKLATLISLVLINWTDKNSTQIERNIAKDKNNKKNVIYLSVKRKKYFIILKIQNLVLEIN